MKIHQEVDGLDGEKIILLDWEGQPSTFCNLRKLNADGLVLWTATPYRLGGGTWTEISFVHGRLEAYNWDGFRDVIDYDTGRILDRKFVK